MGLSSDRGIQATSEGGNVTDVTFVETVPLKYDTQKTTSLTKRRKILPQLRFLDPGGPFAPIFARISKVRLQ